MSDTAVEYRTGKTWRAVSGVVAWDGEHLWLDALPRGAGNPTTVTRWRVDGVEYAEGHLQTGPRVVVTLRREAATDA